MFTFPSFVAKGLGGIAVPTCSLLDHAEDAKVFSWQNLSGGTGGRDVYDLQPGCAFALIAVGLRPCLDGDAVGGGPEFL